MAVPKPKDTTRFDEIGLRAHEFWQGSSLEELARQQGVRPVLTLEEFAGGWPEGQIDDDFEEALERYRRTGSWD